ncbi:MAG: cupredoxin domain-containing protein [Paenibacillaceae bacterium]
MKKILGLFLVLSLVFALSACGSKKEDTSSSIADPVKATGTTEAATELQFKANGKTFKFDKEEYTIKKGEPIKLTLVNESGIHGIIINGLNVNLKNGAMSKTITPDKAGTYDVICSIPCGSGHMTMKAKLIVV